MAGRVKRLKEREHEAAAAKEREQETGAMFQVEMNNENKKDGSSRWLSTATHIFLFFPAFLVSLLHCRNTLFPFDQLPSGILLFMLLLFSRSFPSQIFAKSCEYCGNPVFINQCSGAKDSSAMFVSAVSHTECEKARREFNYSISPSESSESVVTCAFRPLSFCRDLAGRSRHSCCFASRKRILKT